MADGNSYNTTIMTRAEFESSPLKSMYSSYEDYFSKALKYSTFDLAKSNKFNINFDYKREFINLRIKAHEKHNAESEQLIARYKELEQIYLAMKNEQHKLNNSLQRKYNVSTNNDLLSAMSEKSQFDFGMYNKSAKTTDEAYQNFIAALQTANYQTHRIV